MFQYVVRRLLLMIPTLLGVAVITFGLIKLAPGSVESMKFAATAQAGGAKASADGGMVEKFRRKYLLDQPLWKQFAHYMGPFNLGEDGHKWFGGTGEDPWNGLLAFDLGSEFLRPTKHVQDEIWQRLWRVTLPLAAASILLSYLLALPLGVYAAVRQGTPLEVSSTVLLFLLYAVPTFWAGLMLQLAFGKTGLDLLPVIGIEDKDFNTLSAWGQMLDRGRHLILPLVCYTYGSLAYLSRQMRVGVVDAITQDYVRTARAKGLSEKVVILKHVLRNSMIPIITLLASILPILIGGSIIIEVVFDLPGMGKYAYEGLIQREPNVIMATTLFTALMTMLGILLSDIVYAVVDPRIRYD